MDRPTLVPPVQVEVCCPACGYSRGGLALNPRALDDLLRCERCREPNDVLSHRSPGGPACACCSPV